MQWCLSSSLSTSASPSTSRASFTITDDRVSSAPPASAPLASAPLPLHGRVPSKLAVAFQRPGSTSAVCALPYGHLLPCHNRPALPRLHLFTSSPSTSVTSPRTWPHTLAPLERKCLFWQCSDSLLLFLPLFCLFSVCFCHVLPFVLVARRGRPREKDDAMPVRRTVPPRRPLGSA